MKQLFQFYKSGELRIAEVPVPKGKPGHLLVQIQASLVSVGTEKSMIELARKSLLGKGPVIGTVGRIEPVKGFDLLIRAMPIILRWVPRTTLLIASHDLWGYGRTLQSLIGQLGLDKQVRLVGFQRDICSFLHALDIFVFASRSEGFGQVVVEAMAAGRPVVVSAIPPLTEIVVNGETGLWTAPENSQSFAEAISWLLSHPNEASKMGEQGRKWAENLFTAKRMVKQVLKIYHKVARR